MRYWLYRHWDAIGGILLAVALLLGLLFIAPGCGALKRAGLVGLGAGAGAVGGGALGGPPGAVGGAILVGGGTSAVVEADASEDRADAANDRAARAGTGQAPQRVPWYASRWFPWLLIVLYLVWRNREHLRDLLKNRGGRADAALRAVGVRTHRSPAVLAKVRLHAQQPMQEARP